MQSFLGFADLSIAVIYILNIAVVLFCLVYGWKACRHGAGSVENKRPYGVDLNAAI
jgi:hypothetical protein